MKKCTELKKKKKKIKKDWNSKIIEEIIIPTFIPEMREIWNDSSITFTFLT